MNNIRCKASSCDVSKEWAERVNYRNATYLYALFCRPIYELLFFNLEELFTLKWNPHMGTNAFYLPVQQHRLCCLWKLGWGCNSIWTESIFDRCAVNILRIKQVFRFEHGSVTALSENYDWQTDRPTDEQSKRLTWGPIGKLYFQSAIMQTKPTQCSS